MDSYVGELLYRRRLYPNPAIFFRPLGKVSLLDWLRKIPRKVLDLPVYAYAEVGNILARYADWIRLYRRGHRLARPNTGAGPSDRDVLDFSIFRVGKARLRAGERGSTGEPRLAQEDLSEQTIARRLPETLGL